MKKVMFYVLLFSSGISMSSCSLLKKKGVSCYNCSKKETVGHTQNYFETLVNLYTQKRWVPGNIFLSGRAVELASTNPSTVVQYPDPNKVLTFTTKAKSQPVPAPDPEMIMDSRSAWFSIARLKEFICTIEKYNSRLTNSSKELGIRFYYAVYPVDHPQNADKLTLILVPTRRVMDASGNLVQVDFDPRKEYTALVQKTPTDSFGLKKPFLGIYLGSNRRMFMAAKEASLPDTKKLSMDPNCTESTCMNDASLCPPCSKSCKHGLWGVQ